MEIKKFFGVEEFTEATAYDTTLDQEALSRSIGRHNGTYARFAVLSASAEKQALLAKQELKVVESLIFIEVTDAAEESGKKVTQALTEAKVQTHPRVREAYSKYVDAVAQESLGKDLVRQISQRGNLLISAAKMLVAERAGKSSV